MGTLTELFTLLVPTYPNCPGNRPLKRVIVCCLCMTQEFHNSLRLNTTFNSSYSANNIQSHHRPHHNLTPSSSAGAMARTTQPAAHSDRPLTGTATSLESTGTDLASSHVTVSNAAVIRCTVLQCYVLQCFDAVGWAAGRASGP